MSVETLARQLAATDPATVERFLATCDAIEAELVDALSAAIGKIRCTVERLWVAGEGFDHRDPAVRAVMERRAREQGTALGSPVMLGDAGRRVVTDVAEMRSAHEADRDPLGVDQADVPDDSMAAPDAATTFALGGWVGHYLPRLP